MRSGRRVADPSKKRSGRAARGADAPGERGLGSIAKEAIGGDACVRRPAERAQRKDALGGALLGQDAVGINAGMVIEQGQRARGVPVAERRVRVAHQERLAVDGTRHRFYGVSTKYLPNYLGWHRMLDRADEDDTAKSLVEKFIAFR